MVSASNCSNYRTAFLAATTIIIIVIKILPVSFAIEPSQTQSY